MLEGRDRLPDTDDSKRRNWAKRLGGNGLALSILGVAGLIAGPWLSTVFGPGSPTLITCIVLSFAACLSGLIAGLMGAFVPPRRMAVWAALIGFYGSMHIPTFVTMFMQRK